ncbi:ComEC/Rec2 family competence protein [Hyphococcus luteus]|nr:ComEC/Rec2 family competence protein [Marinicaulis flavus]
MVAEFVKTGLKEEGFAKAPSLARLLFLAEKSVRRWAAADFARLSLWTPVAIGLGAGLYFGLKAEPHWGWGAGAFALLACLFLLQSGPFRKATAALMFVSLGFVAADLRTARVDAPQLTRDLGIVETTGRIISVEESARQRRYVLAVEAIEDVAPEALPARARVTWRGEGFDARPGDRVTVLAGLSPPPPPVAPGAFDFARQLYFKRIGAVGFAVTAPEIDRAAGKSFSQKLAARVETMRLSLAERIVGSAQGQGGAILAAIVTGKRGFISETSEAALRDAGLAHLLAISGLHMGLATGLVFFIVRFSNRRVQSSSKFSFPRFRIHLGHASLRSLFAS